MQLRAHNPSDYLFILGTVLLTVYGQLVLKWQVGRLGPLPESATAKALTLGRLFLNPWVITCVIAAVLAMVSWMAALTKFQLTFAYPFVSVTFALVLLLGAAFFGETITTGKAAGVVLIILGVALGAKG